MEQKIRVRIAPSPTGYLHVGTVRTALFNWLFAKKHGGEFILRIEDTDLERSDKKYETDIIEGLQWLGLDWSGPPSQGYGGVNEIYRQSERLNIYKKYLQELLNSGKAFWCHHSKEELEAEQKEQMAKREAPRHLCAQKNKNLQEKDGAIIRLNVNTASEQKRTFKDIIRGGIAWSENLIGDISLAKNIDTPLYNFAVVVDDIDMEISHVIRGEDHISNTPKQILIYEALSKKIPEFAHLPLILASDKSKLSKRHGATAVTEYKKDYLPEALVNFMGFLGYTYSKEIMSKEEMAQEFELEKVHKSGAIFDTKKLNWLNSQYIKNLTPGEFKKLSGIPELTDEAIPLITERLEKLTYVSNFNYFWNEPSFAKALASPKPSAWLRPMAMPWRAERGSEGTAGYEKELLKWKKSDLQKSLETLAEVKKILENFDFRSKDELRKILDEFSVKIGDRGLVYWPLRVALTGKDKSPDPVDIAFVLGKQKVLERIHTALLRYSAK